MRQAILYVHGKGGSAAEAEQYRKSCPGFDLLGVDYQGELPWMVEPQIAAAYDGARQRYDRISILANSIGAYFAMLALQNRELDRALFVSPVVDMERLILDMMGWAGVSERELREKGEIPTSFGETLSWRYLCFVREHPITWRAPTEILYAGGDHLVSRRTVERFAAAHGAGLTVLEGGEHWFQLLFYPRLSRGLPLVPPRLRRRALLRPAAFFRPSEPHILHTKHKIPPRYLHTGPVSCSQIPRRKDAGTCKFLCKS